MLSKQKKKQNTRMDYILKEKEKQKQKQQKGERKWRQKNYSDFSSSAVDVLEKALE